MRGLRLAYVCLGALSWACSIYEGANLPGEHGGADGADVGSGGASVAGTGGGASGSGGSDTTSAATTGASDTSSSTSTGTAGLSGAGGMTSSGTAGTGPDASMAGSGGGSATGGAAGKAGADTSDARDQGNPTADAKADAAPDVPPDNGCPNPTLCALKAALVHRYTFDGTGTRATDSVGTAHGTVINAQLAGNGTVVLAGGSSDQYVDLPNGIIKSLTNATFETWVTWNGGAAWQRIFDFGNSDADAAEGLRGSATTTLYLTPQAMMVASFPGPSVMLVGFKRSDVISDNETHVMSSQALATGMMMHVAVVVDDTNNQMTLYKNGAFESSVAFTDSLSMLSDVNNWLGRSQYSADSSFAGTIHEFRIYGVALSQSAIMASYAAGANPAFLN